LNPGEDGLMLARAGWQKLERVAPHGQRCRQLVALRQAFGFLR